MFLRCCMNIERFNLNLFHSINAPENASELTISFAVFSANILFYIVILFFVLSWFKGDLNSKKQIIKATLFTVIAFLLSQLISMYYYYPRPFVADIGRTLIEHTPNGSFPSDHMLFFSTIAFAYVFSKQKYIGYVFIILAFIVAWSRVYVGVHYPLDMLGAFTMALLLNIVGLPLWKCYSNVIVSHILKWYEYFFSKMIKKGFIR